jgi:hypothetical protein
MTHSELIATKQRYAIGIEAFANYPLTEPGLDLGTGEVSRHYRMVAYVCAIMLDLTERSKADRHARRDAWHAADGRFRWPGVVYHLAPNTH